MNTTQPIKRIKTCKCGQAFTIETRNQKSCPTCVEAKRAAMAAVEAARPPHLCRECGKEFERCNQWICPDCREVMNAAYRARCESECLDRCREPAEICIELYMAKYGPESDSMNPRQHLALDRKIASMVKKLTTGDVTSHDEFIILVCVIAFRQGVLTEERWAQMRRMAYLERKWRNEIRELYKVVAGHPLKEPRGWSAMEGRLSSDHLEPTLPMLRKLFEDPTVTPAAKNDADSGLDTRFRSLLDSFAMIFYLRATPDRQAKMRDNWKRNGHNDLLDLVGYPVKEPELLNPEQIAHADQDAIDTIAATLLAELDI